MRLSIKTIGFGRMRVEAGFRTNGAAFIHSEAGTRDAKIAMSFESLPRRYVMDQDEYRIEFPGVQPSEANKYASELQEWLLDINPEVQIKREREEPLTQDFGSTLVLILGTEAAVAIAHGIADWLRKRHNASITVWYKGPDGEWFVVAGGIDSKNTVKLGESFAPKKR